jgi:hypothetical protein
MLGETFNDLVFMTNDEGLNAFIWFNGHVHDGAKVIQYCMLHPTIFDFFPSNVSAKPLEHVVHKGKWAFDSHPTQS